MECLKNRGRKVYIFWQGRMTLMAAIPIYGKNLKKIFFRITGPIAIILACSIRDSSFVFSSPEPKAQGELLPSANVRRATCVRREQLLQTTSPLKPLGLGP